jgi:sortase A
MKSKLSTIFLFVMLFVGLSLLLYPTVSDYLNSVHQSTAIADYTKKVANLSKDDYYKMLDEARQYNEELLKKPFRWKMTEQEKAEYERILDISGTGIMGYIEIPSINVSLPIYHGTNEGVLQVAIGHLEGSSLPVGGASTHTVVSGHRGLPSAKLFTDLDKLNQGDKFVIRVLDEVYTYEVDRILIVEPDDISGLAIEDGMDYCTLVTCTPYAVNTHRLLVRGHRVENEKEAKEIRVTADAMQIDTIIVASVVAVPILLILFVTMMITTHKGKNKGEG